MTDELRREVEDELINILRKFFGAENNIVKDYVFFDLNKLADPILTLIRKREIDFLESLKWEPRESWADDVVRHNGQIDIKIQQLKEVGDATKSRQTPR